MKNSKTHFTSMKSESSGKGSMAFHLPCIINKFAVKCIVGVFVYLGDAVIFQQFRATWIKAPNLLVSMSEYFIN